jgi:hypothetical protein
VSLTFHSALRKLNTEPSIGASPQMLVHLAKQSQRRRFLEIDQPKTRIAYGSHVCQRIGTKWAIFIEDLTQILPTKFDFIWPNGFRGKAFFINRPIRNKNCLWRPCLLIDRDEMINLNRGSSIDTPTKFRFIWPTGFKRRLWEIDQSETRIYCGGHVC